MGSIPNVNEPSEALNRVIAWKILDEVSAMYPWYDSQWLGRYVAAKKFIGVTQPDLLPEFVNAFQCLRIRPDFTEQKLENVFDRHIMERIRDTIRQMPPELLENTKPIASVGMLFMTIRFFQNYRSQCNPLLANWQERPSSRHTIF